MGQMRSVARALESKSSACASSQVGTDFLVLFCFTLVDSGWDCELRVKHVAVSHFGLLERMLLPVGWLALEQRGAFWCENGLGLESTFTAC